MSNEFEIINSILDSNAKTKIEYSPEELDKLTSIFNQLMMITEDPKNIKNLTEESLQFLLKKSIINNQQYEYLNVYSYYISLNMELKEESIKNIKKIISYMIDKLKNINEIVENKEIKELKKVVDNEFCGVNENQLDSIFKMILESKLSLEEKRDLFINISINSIENVNKTLEEADDEIKGITREEALELFKKYGYDFNYLEKKYQEVILKSANYQRMLGIFDVLKEYDINLYNDFNHNIIKDQQYNICEILTKSNAKCVKGIINNCFENDFIKDGKVMFYLLIEDPGKFINEKREYRRRINRGVTSESSEYESGKFESYLANVKYFKEICDRLYGEKVKFLKRLYEKSNGSLLNYPHKKILEIEKVLKTYGFSEKDYFESATSVFMTMHHADVLDTAIELGLLDYLKMNQSRLSLSLEGELPDLLYIASLDPNNSFRKDKKTNFGGEKEDSIKLKLSSLRETRRLVAIPQGIKSVFLSKEVFEMYRMFDERLANCDFDISKALDMIESDEFNNLKVLENNFKKDYLTYEINGLKISRLKVLRIYSALNNLTLDPEKSEYLVLLYALTKNSYFTREQIVSFAHTFKAKKDEEMKGRAL